MTQVRLIEAREAELIRDLTEGDATAGELLEAGGRIWLPIGIERATGKARCRECGGKIPKDTDCIAFHVDWYAAAGTWGKLAKGHLHREGEC